MWSLNVDISEKKTIKIQCPYCDWKQSFRVNNPVHEIFSCENNPFVCGKPFVLGVLLMTSNSEEFAYVTTRKIEGLEGGMAKLVDRSKSDGVLESEIVGEV